MVLYHSKIDIKQISGLIEDIQAGRISRNKNYFTLAKAEEFSRFKRAKLLISLLEDIEKTALVQGNKIATNKGSDYMELSLYNPELRYNRRVLLSEAELELVKSRTNLIII